MCSASYLCSMFFAHVDCKIYLGQTYYISRLVLCLGNLRGSEHPDSICLHPVDVSIFCMKHCLKETSRKF